MRKLATIRKINEIRDIPEADSISAAVIDGWEVVVKKGEFKAGDYVIYIEIDSWVPTEIASFLSKGKIPKVFNGVSGERLKTVRMRGQLSQGLVLNYWDYPAVVEAFHKTRVVTLDANGESDDFDVTDLLGIQKWEPPVSATLGGNARGNFPNFIPKTEQERVQNMGREFRNIDHMLRWEVTEKLDGSSMTAYLNDDVFSVCSRNLDLEPDDTNTYWKVARQNKLEEFLRNKGRNIAIQGEMIGESIQKNPYGLKGQHFYIFDIYDIDRHVYLNYSDRLRFLYNDDNVIVSVLEGFPIAENLLRHAPIVDTLAMFKNYESSGFLEYAEGNSLLNPRVAREGLVFKCFEKPHLSFKAISNSWLLKNDSK